MKKTGHRSGTKERIGEKHKEKDVILKKHEHRIWYVKGRLQKKKHISGEQYGVVRKRTGGAMRNKEERV